MSGISLASAIRLDGRYIPLLTRFPRVDQMWLDLTQARRRTTLALMLSYLAGGQEVQVEKLLLALEYLNEGNRISSFDEDWYRVRGDHGLYSVRLVPASCECPLFLGEGKFQGNPGTCSHFLLAMICVA
ncbi:MAG TPA: hypothetical protein VGH44_00785 [Candidatus Saccharimonadia bacterium]|jgi:hypothetical protein